MIAQLRQEKILESLKKKEVVYLKDLATEMGTSESTIRRDILKLEQEKRIESVRGGAIRLRSRRIDPPTLENQKLRMDIKHIIARKAAELVQDGDIIYIDAGTTTSAMTKYLEGKHITVVTPSLEVLQQLPVSGVSFVVVGGELNYELASFCGPIAEKELSTMYFDKSFISASAYSEQGVFANDIREGRKKEIVKEHSSETYVLADRTKQQQWGFMQVISADECVIISETDEDLEKMKEG